MKGHTGRDLLNAEMDKLTRWEIAIATDHNTLRDMADTQAKDGEICGAVFGVITEISKEIFKQWAEINALLDKGEEVPKTMVDALHIQLMILGGVPDSAPEELKEAGKYNYLTKSSSGETLLVELQKWAQIRGNIEDVAYSNAFLQRMERPKLEHWLETLLKRTADERGLLEGVEQVKEGLAYIEASVAEFTPLQKAFFDKNPVDHTPGKSGKALQHSILQGSGNKDPFAELKKETQRAIRKVIEFQSTYLKMTHVLVATFRDMLALSDRWTDILYRVAKASGEDFKLNNEEIPDDLKQAIADLAPKNFKR